MKLTYLEIGNLIFCAPFLYYHFYIKLNLGVLQLSLFKLHIYISTLLFMYTVNFYNVTNSLFFEVSIILYFCYYVYLLFQLLITNYQEIFRLLKTDLQTIHNVIIVSFIFYFTFAICFVNLIYKTKHFNVLFLIFFILYNSLYIWSITNGRFRKINITFSTLKLIVPLEKIVLSKTKINTIDFSFNWIKTSSTSKSCDEKVTLSIEPYINLYFAKLDSIHEEPYNTFFNSSELTMLDFSNECNIPINHLRYLFKNHSKISFHEFKRMCQIKNAVHLIDNNYLKKDTFEALSKKTGFLSYSSFYVNFKKYTNLLPLEYLKRN